MISRRCSIPTISGSSRIYARDVFTTPQTGRRSCASDPYGCLVNSLTCSPENDSKCVSSFEFFPTRRGFCTALDFRLQDHPAQLFSHLLVLRLFRARGSCRSSPMVCRTESARDGTFMFVFPYPNLAFPSLPPRCSAIVPRPER